MKPSALMWTGAGVSIVMCFCAVIGNDPSPVVAIFAGGAVFGKGYGIWEERSRKKPEREMA